MALRRLIKRTWQIISDVSTATGLLPNWFSTGYIIALVWAGGAMIAGWAQGQPVMWIMVGGTATVAYAFAILLWFSQWRFLQSVRDKLSFSRVLMSGDLDDKGMTQNLTFGFEIASSATFPIVFEIEEIVSSFKDNYPPRRPFEVKKFTIPPNGKGWFYDFPISVKEPPKSSLAQGGLSFHVKFGRDGNLRYRFDRKFKVTVGFDANGAAIVANYNDLTHSSETQRLDINSD